MIYDRERRGVINIDQQALDKQKKKQTFFNNFILIRLKYYSDEGNHKPKCLWRVRVNNTITQKSTNSLD